MFQVAGAQRVDDQPVDLGDDVVRLGGHTAVGVELVIGVADRSVAVDRYHHRDDAEGLAFRVIQ